MLHAFLQITTCFDVTVTNIKLATHGRMDSMNNVLISLIVASTFNAHLDSWEPIVEPFDGIFKNYPAMLSISFRL